MLRSIKQDLWMVHLISDLTVPAVFGPRIASMLVRSCIAITAGPTALIAMQNQKCMTFYDVCN